MGRHCCVVKDERVFGCLIVNTGIPTYNMTSMTTSANDTSQRVAQRAGRVVVTVPS
jgi:hypothetical protein